MRLSKYKIIALTGALAVIFGAFGAHALKPLLSDIQIETYKTASLYHFIHVLAMFVLIHNSKSEEKIVNLSFYLFAAGIVLFSGSLYILSLKELIGGNIWKIVGPITPIGGLLFIAGWLNLWRIKEFKNS